MANLPITAHKRIYMANYDNGCKYKNLAVQVYTDLKLSTEHIHFITAIFLVLLCLFLCRAQVSLPTFQQGHLLSVFYKIEQKLEKNK